MAGALPRLPAVEQLRGNGGQRRRSPLSARSAQLTPPQELSQVVIEATDRIPLPLAEFNRVLGGGLVAGSLVLISGDPGIGKSTLLLQASASMARRAESGGLCLRRGNGAPD